MRKVIGIGETVFDIIFKNGQPISGRPGGSVFNAMISLGRMGQHPLFISEVGEDIVGKTVRQCMTDNDVSTDYMCSIDQCKSAVALAFLDANEHPDYMFYNDYPKDNRLDFTMPDIREDDIVLMGSFFALDPDVHEQLITLLDQARNMHAIVYYDVNFRKNLVWQARHLMPALLENMEYADIIKGSDEDFVNIFDEHDSKQTYDDHVEFFTKNFLFTQGDKGATVYGNGFCKSYPALKAELVSTVGAGDSFNAGIIYGLLKYGITYNDLKGSIDEATWNKVVRCGIEFSAHVCGSLENYVSPDFAARMKASD